MGGAGQFIAGNEGDKMARIQIQANSGTDGWEKDSWLADIKENRVSYLMALPGILFLILFCYVPYYYLAVAFQDFNLRDGILKSPWIGFDNFKFFFSAGGYAFRTTFNTLYLNTLFIVTNLIAQVSLAIFVNELKNKFFKGVTQSFYFFPFFLSWVVIGEIIYNIFSSDYGTLNHILSAVGLPAVQWYKHSEYWRGILVLANIWKNTGYGTLVYLATMSGFDSAYYEAAIVDGANKFQCIRRITLPMLKPTMVVLVLYSIGRIFFGDFGMVYGVVRDIGPLLDKVEIIDTYVFRAFRQTGSIGMSVAIGLYQSVFGLLVIVITNRLAKKFNDGTALF
jgi:multiple sugar transport system permease protein/putative aldouronate transport system permease protein